MADDVYQAADVAVELRRRLPDVGAKKLHKLLCYCQGHHLADVGRPLFVESIAAWDRGPVVGGLWKHEQAHGPVHAGRPLDQAAFNTIGYVLSRFGRLTGRDLEILTHAELPWRVAPRTLERSAKLHRPDDLVRLNDRLSALARPGG